MKLPLWALNKDTGKYELFPLHLLDTLSNGSKGLSFFPWRENYTREELFKKYRDYFVSNPIAHEGLENITWEYALKDQEK
jgi:hypothetical protein